MPRPRPTSRRRYLVTAVVILAILTALAAGLAAAAPSAADQAGLDLQEPSAQLQRAESRSLGGGSLEFVVNGVIGRALNVPGTY